MMTLSDFIQQSTTSLRFIPVIAPHELADAGSPFKLGDKRAKTKGRISLNRIARNDLRGRANLSPPASFANLFDPGMASLIV